MFQTSQDILYLVLSCSIALLTVLLSWLLIECAILLRRTNKMVREFKARVEKIEAALSGIRDKIEHSVGYMHLVAEGIKQAMDFFGAKKETKKKKK